MFAELLEAELQKMEVNDDVALSQRFDEHKSDV